MSLMGRLGGFLNNMDARAMTSLSVSIVLLIFVILMFTYGQQWLQLDDEDALKQIMDRAYSSPWAVLGVISVYVLLALTGFPQILLIAVTVLTFGPRNGAVYAWIATMVSASFTFGLGHILGGTWVRRFGGDRVQRTIDFLGRHGILASALVRVVPSAPFIVVNAAAGAAHIPMWKFWSGTGLGIIPKILLVATLGAFVPDSASLEDGVRGILTFFSSREPKDLAILAVIIFAWLAFLLFVRWIYMRMRQDDPESE